MDISHTFCRSATKFGRVRGLANRNLYPEFRELWHRIQGSRDTMRRHASVLRWYICNNFTTCKVVFRQLPHVCR